MAEFHFVADYEKYVAKLVSTYPIDEAPQAFADLTRGRQGRGVIIFDAA